MTIKSITAYEILASGGYPTLEVQVTLTNGTTGVASVPYGVSAGSHEAVMLTDGDSQRYSGKGVLQAIENVKQIIAPILIGLPANEQRIIDEKMIALDSTSNKTRLGGNAILGVSVAVARAAARAKNIELYQHIIETFDTQVNLHTLPQPMMVSIEGGKHAHETTDLQEYCLTALQIDQSPTANIQKVLESYHQLRKILEREGLSTNVGNEGAFAPNGIKSNEAPFEYLLQAIQAAGFTPGQEIGISVDAAANEFFADNFYNLKVDQKNLTASELNSYYENWLQKYPAIKTLEDMHAEDDWEAWTAFKKITDKYNIPLIGDDLTVTSLTRLQEAIDKQAISAILIKLNQVGSLTETVDCCLLATQQNLMIVTSHRGGGETNDTAMVDLAVAVGSKYIKVGPTRGERVSKYNRLMEIERQLKQ